MTSNIQKQVLTLFLSACSFGLLGAMDFGDQKSSTLTGKAWGAFGSNNDSEALAYIGKCIELYAAEAKKMQDGMSGYASASDAHSKWALNDVGTCLFIKGELLSRKGDTQGAIDAYNKLVKEFNYAQVWDAKGWFWKPAEAAKQKVVELSMDL